MTFIDLLLNGIEVQGKYKYYYYDEKNERRVELTYEQGKDKEINYIYCENGVLCVEVAK